MVRNVLWIPNKPIVFLAKFFYFNFFPPGWIVMVA